MAKRWLDEGAGKSNMEVKIIVNTASAFHAFKVTLNAQRERSKDRKEGWKIPNLAFESTSQLQLGSPSWHHNCTDVSVPLLPWQWEGKHLFLFEGDTGGGFPSPFPLLSCAVSSLAERDSLRSGPHSTHITGKLSKLQHRLLPPRPRGWAIAGRRFISTVQELKKSLSSLDTGDIAISAQTAHPHLSGPIYVLLIFHTP